MLLNVRKRMGLRGVFWSSGEWEKNEEMKNLNNKGEGERFCSFNFCRFSRMY